MTEKEILEGLKKAPMDFIANNYFLLSREQLRDILKEFIYIATQEQTEEVIEELENIWED